MTPHLRSLPLWTLVGPELRAAQLRPAALVGLSALAGVGSTAVLGVLGGAGERGEGLLWHLLLLLGAVALYAVCQLHVSRITAREVEGLLGRLRLDLLGCIRRADLAAYERIGRARLVGTLVGDVQRVSAAAASVVNAAQAALQLLFATLYLFLLSRTAFVLGTGVAVLVGIVYLRRLRGAAAALTEASADEQAALEGLEDALRGAAQVKQSSARSAALREHVARLSEHASGTREAAHRGLGGVLLYGQLMFYMLLGIMIWVLPAWGLAGPTVAKATTVLLFVLGSIGSLLQGMVVLADADAAAARLLALRGELAALPEDIAVHAAEAGDAPPEFHALELRGVTYRHRAPDGTPGFGVGPVDLLIRRGEVVFLSGGNGAGKTTLVKLVAGLYPPEAGLVRVDGRAVPPSNPALRRLVAVVFSDFHLSRRLWGVPDAAEPHARALLERFGLAGKVDVRGGSFTTTELSTGERKRLALVAALLEDRPMLVLDEFAADQDPEFRRRFYREILPWMHGQGLTVVAVTHDDAFFDAANRLLVMEEGRLRERGAVAQ